jgi:peptidyl-prolyl cis-trans isomerase B (cyclophilin B)
VADNTFLDHKAPRGDAWGYCVFGRVVQGMDVVNAILAVKTTSKMGHQDVPAEDVVIESVQVIDE